LSGLFPWLQFLDDVTLVLESSSVAISIVDTKRGSMAREKAKGDTTGANLDFEAKLWNMAEFL